MPGLHEILPEPSGNRSIGYGMAVAACCIALATALRAVIDPIVSGVPFITFFPAVAAAAYFGGSRAGTVTTLIGGLVAAYFWVPPLHSIALARDQWITVVIYAFLSGLLVLLTHKLRRTAARANEAEKTASLYAQEMIHRTRNLVSLVQAVATMTFRDKGSADEQRHLFNQRLVALIRVTGVVVGARPEAAARLSLIMHELATNAVKYGALSRSEGQVNITATIENETLVLAWHETGGPIVDPKPVRRGFGTRLLASSLSRGTGSVDVTFDPAGLSARIVLEKNQLSGVAVLKADPRNTS